MNGKDDSLAAAFYSPSMSWMAILTSYSINSQHDDSKLMVKQESCALKRCSDDAYRRTLGNIAPGAHGPQGLLSEARLADGGSCGGQHIWGGGR